MRIQATGLAALCAAALMGCGGGSDEEGPRPDTVLRQARDYCVRYAGEGTTKEIQDAIRLVDKDRTLLIDATDSDQLLGVYCVMNRLDTASEVQSTVQNTSSMPGRQSAEAGGLTYEWSYDPDSGLDMTITEGERSDAASDDRRRSAAAPTR